MNIYLVKRTDEIGWDEYDAWVVAATTPKEAKELCVWWAGPTAKDLKCKVIGTTTGKPRQILGSFKAG